MFSDESEKEKRKVKNPIAELLYCNKAFDINSRLTKGKNEKWKIQLLNYFIATRHLTLTPV